MTLDVPRSRVGSSPGTGLPRLAATLSLLAVAMATSALPVFAQERALERVSVRPDGSGSQGGGSYGPAVSTDGRFVAFSSLADDLVAGDTNGVEDVFVRDLEVGVTTRVSVATDGSEGDEGSSGPSLSADGRFVAFVSAAGNLVEEDGNESHDVFVHDRESRETTRISMAIDGHGDDGGGGASISADGRFVAFTSSASRLVEGDANAVGDVFVHDRETGRTTRVSVAMDGSEGNGISDSPSISADGRLVAFASFASNLSDDSAQGFWGIYLHDLETGQTSLLSIDGQGSPGNEDCTSPAISADGGWVAYESLARNLTDDSPQGFWGIYLHDLETGRTSLLTRGLNGSEQDGDAFAPAISSDGRHTAFWSTATNLVEDDSNGYRDVFLHDHQTGETIRLSAPPDGGAADEYSEWPAIAGDGSVVAFQSWAGNLVADDTGGEADIFVSTVR